jgi:hypothetical protein
MTWSLFRKNVFMELLQKLGRLNDYLRELLDDHQMQFLQDAQQMSYMTLVQTRSSVDDLKALAEAAQSLQHHTHTSGGWQQKSDLELENLATFKAFYASVLDSSIGGEKAWRIAASDIQLEYPITSSDRNPKATYRSKNMELRSVWISWQNKQPSGPKATSLSLVEELTALLMAQKPDEFCVPPCLGYFELEGDEAAQNLGLVFHNPPHVDPQLPPISLLQAMDQIAKPSLT